MKQRSEPDRSPRGVLFRSLARKPGSPEVDQGLFAASRHPKSSSCVCSVHSSVGSVPSNSAAFVNRCVASTDPASLAKSLAANIKGAARTKLSRRIAERLSKRSGSVLRVSRLAQSAEFQSRAGDVASGVLRQSVVERRAFPTRPGSTRLQ